jgi:hypothetical protein
MKYSKRLGALAVAGVSTLAVAACGSTTSHTTTTAKPKPVVTARARAAAYVAKIDASTTLVRADVLRVVHDANGKHADPYAMVNDAQTALTDLADAHTVLASGGGAQGTQLVNAANQLSSAMAQTKGALSDALSGGDSHEGGAAGGALVKASTNWDLSVITTWSLAGRHGAPTILPQA